MFTSRARRRSSVRRHRPGERSQALVIVLGMVVIASVLVVAFFAAVRFDFIATSSYGQSLKAEQIGLGGLQLVVGQLQQEMGKDGAPTTGGALGTNILYTTFASPSDIVPQGVGTNSAMPSLLKMSTNANFYTGTVNNGALSASTVSTATPSINGRYVSAARWNQAYMGTFPSSSQTPYWVYMTRSGPTNAGVSAAYGSTAAGTLNNPTSANTNYVIGRFAYAVYNEGGLLDINSAGYSTNPATAPTTDQLQVLKGTLAGADLSQVGVDPAALVAWRNASTGATAASYQTYVTNAASTNGFLQVASGDRTFLSRQDLIKAALNGTAGLNINALTNLATFTRESTLPSWGPSANAPSGGVYNYASNASVSTGAPFSSTSPNPNRLVSLVRFSGPGTVTDYHSDGTSYTYTVQAGDALLQHRFPLNRINWLGPSGPNASAFNSSVSSAQQAAAIQACFGLVWAASKYPGTTYSCWQYVGPSGSTEQSSIETLDQVAAEATPREPNFFELLQTGILSGSLAVSGDATAATLPQQVPMMQLLRIGANVINQYGGYTATSGGATTFYPAVIEFQPSITTPPTYWQSCGVESLPYINVFKTLNGVSPSNPSSTAINCYLLFGLWNPSGNNTVNATVGRPSVRLRVIGGVAECNNWSTYTAPGASPFWGLIRANTTVIPSTMTPLVLSPNSGVGVNGFASPALISSTDVSTAPTDPGGGPGIGGWAPVASGTTALPGNYIAYRIPDFNLALPPASSPMYSSSWTSNANWQYLKTSLTYNASNPFQYDLEYQDPSGNWVPYNYATGINDPVTWNTTGSLYQDDALVTSNPATTSTPPTATPAADPFTYTFSTTSALMTSDPRSLRFNTWTFQRNTANKCTTSLTNPLWDTAAPTSPNYLTYGYGGGVPATSMTYTPWDVTSVPALFSNWYHPATLCRNNQANAWPYTGYPDNDQIQRIADSGLFPSSTSLTTGDPYQRLADQPVILNRSFNSVAEMGYALRDDPWHSLDFFSASSADAGLLDLFSVREDPQVVAPGQSVRAGRLNLNTKNPAVLAAVLSGIVTDPINKTQLPQATVTALAAQIVSLTSASPLINKSQLVTALGPSVSMTTGIATDPLLAATFHATTGTAADEENIKSRREAYVRALADVGQTRTWNLMIDVVAQSGKFPPSASSASQFVVDGERRYWLHVAIDRLTGQVIAQQLEPVTE